MRSEEHTSELQSLTNLVCRLLLDPPTTAFSTLSLHDALPIFGTGCEREKRAFDAPPVPSNPRAEAAGLPDLQPGQPGRGMQPTASAGGYNERSAYELAQGKQ